MEEATSPSLALDALIDLFESDLERVNFPDVSAAALRDAAESVETQRLAVAAAEATLRGARDALEQTRANHVRLGRRALAYARVYAEGDSDLEARLDGIRRGLDGTKSETSGEAPKKRGRPRKSDVGLFGAESELTSSGATESIAEEETLFAESA